MTQADGAGREYTSHELREWLGVLEQRQSDLQEIREWIARRGMAHDVAFLGETQPYVFERDTSPVAQFVASDHTAVRDVVRE